MKAIFTIVSVLLLGQMASAQEANCTQKVSAAVASLISASENVSGIEAKAQFSKYVGFHVKQYNVVTNHVVALTGLAAKYTVDVVEFETADTNCEILKIQKN